MAAAETTAEFVQGVGRGEEEEGALRKKNQQAEKGGAYKPD